MDNHQSLVSAFVITHNSSRTVVEALDSVYNQTYRNVELIVSDDGSTDNTVDLCRTWVESHKDRFVRTAIITVEKNTGITANCSRATKACQGEWVKGVAGDDLLLPDCIAGFMDYAEAHPDAKYIFGKMSPFGKGCQSNAFQCDYSFFDLPVEQQWHQLIYESNCIQSPTCFYNRDYEEQIGFEYDERIPMMEDYPRWIKLLQLGVRFHFMDKEVVKYRVDSGVSTQRNPSEAFHRSQLLCDMYYRWPEWIKNDEKDGMNRIVESQMKVYRQLLQNEAEVQRLQNTKAYRLGKKILKPLSVFKKQK